MSPSLLFIVGYMAIHWVAVPWPAALAAALALGCLGGLGLPDKKRTAIDRVWLGLIYAASFGALLALLPQGSWGPDLQHRFAAYVGGGLLGAFLRACLGPTTDDAGHPPAPVRDETIPDDSDDRGVSGSILSTLAFVFVAALPVAPWPAAGIGFAVVALGGRSGRETPIEDAGSILSTMWFMLAFAGLFLWIGHLFGAEGQSDPLRFGAFLAGGAVGSAARKLARLPRAAGRSAL